ncbi:MAG: hypothetical protein ACE5D7_07080 [Fidelibacterota bacterium]
MFILHSYTLVEFIFVVYILSKWQNRIKQEILLSLTYVPFFIIWLIAKIFIEDFSNFDNISSSLSSAVITVLSAYVLLELVKEWNKSRGNAVFWVASGFLIYFSGNLVLFALSTTVIISTWAIHNILVIISNLFYVGGFSALRRR